MAWDAKGEVAKLEKLLNANDKAGVLAFCNDLINRIYKAAEPYPLNPATKLLSTLRRRRFFEQMERLAPVAITVKTHANSPLLAAALGDRRGADIPGDLTPVVPALPVVAQQGQQ